MRDGVRLLTLTGPGGIGKTRLAIQLARDVLDGFADGVVWVPLASVRDADAVLPAIAQAVGIGESPALTWLSDLTAVLRDARLLLVLDNFEQVLPAGSQIADLLVRCPYLTALITSRSLLRVSGEHAIDVRPLQLAGLQSAASLEEYAGVESIWLFRERAGAVSPGFVLGPDNAAIVADICRHLEGVPLAIELAAARANHLSMQSLRSRLKRRLPLLTGGGRDQPARHRTMRDAIAWSYELLTDRQQMLFRRLALFPGGCRVDAVESLGADVSASHFTAFESIDGVAILADHSLVRQVADPDGEPRFVMLETIREFALEQLDATGDLEVAESLKASYLADFAEQMELAPLLSGSELMLAVLDREQNNIRGSLSWLQQAGRGQDALRMAGALAYSWIAQGYYREGQSWLEPVLADPKVGSTRDRARALAGLGYMYLHQGDRSRAAAAFEEAIRLWKALESPLHLAIALNGRAAVEDTSTVSEKEAAELLGEVLALSQAIEDARLASFVASLVHDTLGMAANTRGDYVIAKQHHSQALDLRRNVDFTLGICISLRNLGDIAQAQGDNPRALACYREALSVATEHWNPPFIADAIANAVHIAVALGQPERAARLLGAIDALRKVVGIAISMRFDLASLDRVYADAREALGEAAFARAWEQGSAYSLDETIAEVDRIAPTTEVPEPGDRPSLAIARYGLTPREVDVLRCIVERLTDREIAERLFISPRTVGWHVTGILTKLDVTTRRAAAAKAVSESLT
jgi:non-specific serine/threonine protein kinase